MYNVLRIYLYEYTCNINACPRQKIIIFRLYFYIYQVVLPQDTMEKNVT